MVRTRNVLGVVGAAVLLLCSCGWSAEAVKGNVWSNLDVQLYGFIKADAVWNSAQVDNSNYFRWADAKTSNDDREFGLTARETRLGFKITGPELNGWKTRGLLEMDFYGGDSQNKANPMMRHAYLALTNPAQKLTILAGQTWDVVAPLNPHTLNYSVMWWIGNIGYRRPQIRVEKTVDLSKDVSLLTQVALARTIGSAGSGSFDTEPGADSGLPEVQGRVAITMPCIGPKPATFGLSGLYGTEQQDTYITGGPHVSVPTWVGNLDVLVPLCSAATFKGEMFTGSNLSALLGGIGQGVKSPGTTSVHGIRTSGGWFSLAIDPAQSSTSCNLGYGMEKVCDKDLSADNDRISNRCAFGNIIHAVNKSVDVGLEISYFKTTYLNMTSGEGVRVQGSLILKI